MSYCSPKQLFQFPPSSVIVYQLLCNVVNGASYCFFPSVANLGGVKWNCHDELIYIYWSPSKDRCFCVMKDSLCVLMCVCACEHVFTCVCRHLCTYGCIHEEPECSIGCFTQSLSTLYFETRSLSEPKDSPLGQADWPVSSWELPVFVYIPPSPGIAGMLLHTWLFIRALGICIQVLRLV